MFPPLHPSTVRNVVYPIYRGLRGDRVLELLVGLEHDQWLPRAELEDLQWRRLRRLLERAATHVPYYRDIFSRSGLRIDDLQTPDDFLRIPLLTAEKFDPDEVREYADAFFADALYGDALEFYRKLGNADGIAKVKAAGIESGNPELLWRIEHYFRDDVTKADWTACGDNAARQGKARNAAYAFFKSGDEEKRQAAEREFQPPPAEEEPAPAAD